MKCAECPDYRKCSKENDLRRLRGRCPKAKKQKIPTIADKIRAMVATDEGIAKILLALDISLVEDGREFTHLYCDGKNGCITEDDDIICTDEMRTACIVRWLSQPAEEDWP